MEFTFLGLPNSKGARVAIIPAPFEFSTSWKKGTWEGPFEVIKASYYLETFDEEFLIEPHKVLGFYTYPFEELPGDFNLAFEKIYQNVKSALQNNMFPIVIGGEHTVTLANFQAIFDYYKTSIKLIHLDAHADLRNEYLSTKINHATVIRRIIEKGGNVLSIGIRAISKEEYEFAKECLQVKLIMADQVKKDLRKTLDEIKLFLNGEPFFLTLDVDVFDPSLCPGVGTPEPGGLFWEEVLEILKVCFFSGKPLGIDFVETLPLPSSPVTEYTVAKLIFKTTSILAYKYKN